MVIALFFLGITAEQEQCATSFSNSCPHLFCWLHECILHEDNEQTTVSGGSPSLPPETRPMLETEEALGI